METFKFVWARPSVIDVEKLLKKYRATQVAFTITIFNNPRSYSANVSAVIYITEVYLYLHYAYLNHSFTKTKELAYVYRVYVC